MSRPLWVDGLPVPVPVPDDALAVYADDGETVAVVAVPRWDVYVITTGGVIAVPRKAGRKLVKSYFDG
jgi:hypothetical protein